MGFFFLHTFLILFCCYGLQLISRLICLASGRRQREKEKGCWRDGWCHEIIGKQNFGFQKRDGHNFCTGWNEVYEGTIPVKYLSTLSVFFWILPACH